MGSRASNNFQFIDVGRNDLAKRSLKKRKTGMLKSMTSTPKVRLSLSLIAAFHAVILTVNGNVRFTILFPTG